MATATQGQAPPTIPASRALAEAETDALRAYGDLSPYRVQLHLDHDGWHVDYEINDPDAQGGGPHYLIDATTGAIRDKKYYQ
jgi:hypothetical protein